MQRLVTRGALCGHCTYRIGQRGNLPGDPTEFVAVDRDRVGGRSHDDGRPSAPRPPTTLLRNDAELAKHITGAEIRDVLGAPADLRCAVRDRIEVERELALVDDHVPGVEVHRPGRRGHPRLFVGRQTGEQRDRLEIVALHLWWRAYLGEMPDWTKKNFEELRDASPPDAPMQWRFAREALRSPELGVSRFTFDPGARMPWGHRHRVQEEAYVVVAGSGRVKLDHEVVELSVWDVLRVAPAVIRSFEAGPEGLDVICIGGRKPKGGDTERFEDFWN